MDPKRQGEIARVMVKELIRDRGIKVGSDLERELGNSTKKLNELEPALKVTTDELAEMYLELSQELMGSFEKRVRSRLVDKAQEEETRARRLA